MKDSLNKSNGFNPKKKPEQGRNRVTMMDGWLTVEHLSYKAQRCLLIIIRSPRFAFRATNIHTQENFLTPNQKHYERSTYIFKN